LDNKKIKPHFPGRPAHSLVTIPTRFSATYFPIYHSLNMLKLNIHLLHLPKKRHWLDVSQILSGSSLCYC